MVKGNLFQIGTDTDTIAQQKTRKLKPQDLRHEDFTFDFSGSVMRSHHVDKSYFTNSVFQETLPARTLNKIKIKYNKIKLKMTKTPGLLNLRGRKGGLRLRRPLLLCVKIRRLPLPFLFGIVYFNPMYDLQNFSFQKFFTSIKNKTSIRF